jgi:hypothetical protein
MSIKQIETMKNSECTYIRLSYLQELYGSNPETMGEMLQACLAEFEKLIGHLQPSRDLDLRILSRVAHAMKPTGYYLGVECFAKLMESLEKVVVNNNADDINKTVVEAANVSSALISDIKKLLKNTISGS